MLDEAEEVIADGGVARVVRVGMTVRRPVRPFTATVQSFLGHLWRQGLRCIPEPLGYDQQGREVLSYVEGDVPVEPLPEWATGDAVIIELARLIRRLHDAAEGWDPPRDATWGSIPGAQNAAALQPESSPELVAHQDYCPGNVVFRAGLPTALIDFDLARPTTRLADCVNVLYWWAPLLAPEDRTPALEGANVPARCRLFADAYGMSRTDRGQVASIATRRARNSFMTMRTAADLDPVFRRWWDEGVGGRLERAHRWTEVHCDEINAALLG